ncbi:hypothetical protein XELAEV_18028701mg [Xenopus laevis]|uniref:Uncharacterized protein n=1 Tax=Xenopus laevis TaxID=8355 RepID=A0A974CQ32_XENLA|nr:hypothetical protein XELAEV_18028701mg [Xenopus laevis]
MTRLLTGKIGNGLNLSTQKKGFQKETLLLRVTMLSSCVSMKIPSAAWQDFPWGDKFQLILPVQMLHIASTVMEFSALSTRSCTTTVTITQRNQCLSQRFL